MNDTTVQKPKEQITLINSILHKTFLTALAYISTFSTIPTIVQTIIGSKYNDLVLFTIGISLTISLAIYSIWLLKKTLISKTSVIIFISIGFGFGFALSTFIIFNSDVFI